MIKHTDPLAITLEKLNQLLDLSMQAYRNYLDAGKTYQYAKELMACNSEMLALLTSCREQFNDEGLNAIDALLHHYSVWKSKWHQLDATRQYTNEEVFAFANTVTFPKEAASYLTEQLAMIKAR